MTVDSKRQGFTLIELSIVLVIIGLIVGAIEVGRSLIRQSQVASIITDIQNFTSATRQFQQKYRSLPGDMYNATSYWGASANCTSAGSLVSGTCNGNGNGRISNSGQGTPESSGPSPSFAIYHGEDVLFWQHLSLAGMIQGSYAGGNGGANGDASVYNTTTAPYSHIPNNCYAITYGADDPQGGIMVNAQGALYYPPGNVFFLGAATRYGCYTNPTLTPTEAAAIDTKMDDGLPFSGTVITTAYGFYPGFSWTPCVTNSTPYTYITTYTNPYCPLIFQPNF